MVTVVKNPTGHKIIDQAIEATITEDYTGAALVTFANHSLEDGDFIYITSDLDEYNGFWYVTKLDGDTFKISEHSQSEFVGFYQDADIEYYQTQEHVWNSIFLPIVYKLSNDLWPVNSVDTIQAISSAADDNGYTELTLGGNIRTSEVNALEFVKIADAMDPALNGIWQIVEIISLSNLIINLPHDADNDFTGATIQYYYNNYQVKVKIFAGLPASHPWEAKKPYAEMAELSLTPDENNEVMFSVADYIKGQVAIKNNPLIFSYPLNLDAFTAFYISFGESYDDSDNYTLTTQESSLQVDTFEGYAVAGKLPFKNVYSGDYADYVLTSGSPAMWLTMMERPLAIEDKYFDISFIKNIRGQFWVIIDKYVTTYLTATEVIPYADQGIGVYRIPITPDANYDSFCVRIYTPGAPASDGPPATTLADLNDWEDKPGGQTWGGLITSVNGNGGVSDYLLWEIITAAGFNYEFTTAIDLQTNSPTEPIFEVRWSLLDASYNVVDSGVFNYSTAGVKNETITLISATAAKYLGIYATNNTPFSTKSIEVTAVAYNTPAAPTDSIPAQTITEEICIDIIETCEALEGFLSDQIRLLEDGDYRLLE